MKVAVGADHGGVAFKRGLVKALADQGHEVTDLGAHDEASVDYPDFAHACAAKITSGEVQLGILVCRSGVGMNMAANRHRGVRAVVCSEPFSAEMARKHNDANVLCLGTNVVGEGLGHTIVGAFLAATFEGGRHQRRVDLIEVSP